jgi:hypothetical protein
MLSDSNKNSKLLEFEDIVTELSKETNVPYEELAEICKLSLEYTKKLTEDKDTLSILVPELGTLYYSERFGEFYKKRSESYTDKTEVSKKKLNKFYTHRTDLIEKNEKENNIEKSYHRRKPFLYKFKNIYKKMFGNIVKGGATLGHQELWTKFSEIQNNIQNEK